VFLCLEASCVQKHHANFHIHLQNMTCFCSPDLFPESAVKPSTERLWSTVALTLMCHSKNNDTKFITVLLKHNFPSFNSPETGSPHWPFPLYHFPNMSVMLVDSTFYICFMTVKVLPCLLQGYWQSSVFPQWLPSQKVYLSLFRYSYLHTQQLVTECLPGVRHCSMCWDVVMTKTKS
jgi:hypothetical protein